MPENDIRLEGDSRKRRIDKANGGFLFPQGGGYVKGIEDGDGVNGGRDALANTDITKITIK